MWWPAAFNISSYISWLSFGYLYHKAEHLNTSIRVTSYEKGDVVQNFKLDSRLELLGLPTFYVRDDSWKYTLQSDGSSALQQLDQPVSDGSFVVLLDDSKVKFEENCVHNGSFCAHENIFHGGHGEIWRAFRVNDEAVDGDTVHGSGVNRSVSYILKRMRVRNRQDILQCAIREIVFGELLLKSQSDLHLMFARYVTHFESPDKEDYWLVFLDEGMSLQQTMYATVYSNMNALLMPSQLWRNMRTTSSGEVTLKGILYQLLTAVERLHSLNITHRDLKPSNILLNVEQKEHPRLLVADFSSALHSSLMDKLYPGRPSIAEETLLYAPPEVLLSINTTCDGATATAAAAPCPARGDPYFTDLPTSYDMWSVGVIYLELLLGTADVFALDDRSINIITQKLRRKGLRDADSLAHAVLLAGLSEYCIFSPDFANDEQTQSPAQSSYVPSSALTPEETVTQYSGLSTSILTALDYTTTRKKQPSTSSTGEDGGDVGSATLQQQQRGHHYHHRLHHHSYRDTACLSKAILRRDPLGKGFTGLWGLDLLARLLRFDPLERITAGEALQHAYFTGPYVSDLDGSEHGTQVDLEIYNQMLFDDLAETEFEERLTETEVESRGTGGGGTGGAAVGGSEYHPIYLEDNMAAARGENSSTIPDRRIANNQHTIVTEVLGNTDFTCPKCGRVFHGDYAACLKHATLRGHGTHCTYSEHSLPPCLSEHALQPVDPQSGWCDLQGTRQYIEDVHAMYYDDHFNFFGVFDGHFGPNAAKFASKHIYGLFHQFVHSSAAQDEVNGSALSSGSEIDVLQYGERDIRLSTWLQGSERLTQHQMTDRQIGLLSNIPFNRNGHWGSVIKPVNGDEEVIGNLTAAQLMQFLSDSFLLTHNQLIYRHDQGKELSGGSTATTVILTGDYLLVGHVGDSRVIACCAPSSNSQQHQLLLPVQLTLDHTPHSASERQRVESRGGWVDEGGSVPRVNGLLAVTRSLGDPALRSVLSATPDVLMFKYRSNVANTESDITNGPTTTAIGHANHCMLYRQEALSFFPSATDLLFVIAGSDGLWDVMTNLEASELVCEYFLERRAELRGHAMYSNKFLPIDSFHEASKLLAYEALVRLSSDNIGVNVIDLLNGSI